jgi:acyl phosphate:glycerol-3-phosphate acyltransferase
MDFVYFLICYLLGSIPSGLIIGKLFKNIDIREHGSGNLGGTNAIRVLGKKLGTIVTIMDILKGGLAVLLARIAFETNIDPIVFGLVAIIGHIFPIFAKFRGGKAVATSGGILLFYNPFIFLIGFASFIISLRTTKMVSISSTIAAIMSLVATVFFNVHPYFKERWFDGKFNLPFFLVVLCAVLFIIYRHIPNYKRVLNGTESKIGQKKNAI